MASLLETRARVQREFPLSRGRATRGSRLLCYNVDVVGDLRMPLRVQLLALRGRVLMRQCRARALHTHPHLRREMSVVVSTRAQSERRGVPSYEWYSRARMPWHNSSS